MLKIVHAVVGCGRVAPNHFDAFGRIEEVEIRYAVDLDMARAVTFVGPGLAGQATTDFETTIADPELTSISLCVPHDLHAPMALAAVAQGRHVLIEKPFVIDPTDGLKLIEAAQATGVLVMPVAQHRFEDIVATAAEIIHSGQLGQITLVRGHLECMRPVEYYADSNWRGSWAREGGSVLINQAYHIVELIRWMVGPVKNVTARMATFSKSAAMETEDVLTANLEFENNALGALTICGAGGSQWRSYIEIIGLDGDIAFDINFPNTIQRFQLKDKRAMKLWRDRLRAASEGDAELPAGVGYYGAAHRGQAAAFVSRIRGESVARGADLIHAQSVIEMIQAIYAAARRDEPK